MHISIVVLVSPIFSSKGLLCRSPRSAEHERHFGQDKGHHCKGCLMTHVVSAGGSPSLLQFNTKRQSIQESASALGAKDIFFFIFYPLPVAIPKEILPVVKLHMCMQTTHSEVLAQIKLCNLLVYRQKGVAANLSGAKGKPP